MLQFPLVKTQVGIRTKAYLLFLPLVVVVVGVSGILASLEARGALTGVATRLLAYKAEQMQDYVYSEWELLTELGLDGSPEYRESMEASVQSYAASLLRSESEQIIAADSDGEIVMSVGLGGSDPGASISLGDSVEIEPGWSEIEVGGQDRVAVAFSFEPFGWTVAVTELESAFFSDVEAIQRNHAAILTVSLLAGIAVISLFVGYIIRPMEALAGTIQYVSSSNDLSSRAAVTYSDEVGALAEYFNGMLDSLESSYRELEQRTESERNARKTALEREEETLLLLGRISEYRDQETSEHLDRVGTLCSALSRLLGQCAREQTIIHRSSQLHDIGKIAIPDAILRKPGTLTEDEYEQMKLHTAYGYNLLKDAESIYLRHAATIARTHHEKWDGTGYPDCLAGENIPLSGRIVGLVDVFDALTSSRPYKRAWSAEEAREHILEQRGKHFDPLLVDIFNDNFEMLRQLVKR